MFRRPVELVMTGRVHGVAETGGYCNFTGVRCYDLLDQKSGTYQNLVRSRGGSFSTLTAFFSTEIS
jgi:hypothetical protein